MRSTSRSRLVLCAQVAGVPLLVTAAHLGPLPPPSPLLRCAKDMLAHIHEGEAIWPTVWLGSSEPSGKSLEQVPAHAPAESGEA